MPSAGGALRWSVVLAVCSFSVTRTWVLAAEISGDPAPAPITASVFSETLRSVRDKIAKDNEKLNQFVRLLAMEKDQRAKALASRPETRVFLRGELEKYDRMTVEDREAELQSLRVWYHLRALVSVPRAVRNEALKMIAPTDREMVERRLRRWDLLDADLQREVMEHDRFIRYVLELDGLPKAEQVKREPLLPESLREVWDSRLEQWHDVPADRRRIIYHNFKKFFDLTVSERDRVLKTLSQKERDQVKPSLDAIAALDKLTPEERAACLESFKAFAETAPNSEKFLLHLDTLRRWNELSSKERDTLRNVHRLMAPLLPPVPGDVTVPPSGVNREAPPVPGKKAK